jgi:tagaturonate epimerase
MASTLELEKYSIGIGDRFGVEGRAQLRAVQKAESLGVRIVPVWNKSHREHTIIGSSPEDTRRSADEAVSICKWEGSYYVDADHIGLETVDRFLASSNFFTIDVADWIDRPAPEGEIASFVRSMKEVKGSVAIPGIQTPIMVTDQRLSEIARKYLRAVTEAGKVYRHIAEKKGTEMFVAEMSVDETITSQTPDELFLLLAAVAHEGIPIQTVAPKFTGAFLKGVDYVGNLEMFGREFEDDLAVVAYAVDAFHLPKNLKLSVHSGSDKFSLYPIIHKAIKKLDAGVHLKTAGTTWLEEAIGLAASGGDGLKLAKELYGEAFKRYEELCKPYLAVIHIDKDELPAPSTVDAWTAEEYVEALRHNPERERFDSNFRQLIHISFKIAAEMGDRYKMLLNDCRDRIESGVTMNIFERHILPLFLGREGGRTAANGTSQASGSVRKSAGL